jgi:hypothetical protein
MFRRNKKSLKYQAPCAAVTHMALENNFCATVRFNVQVDELDNINSHNTGTDAEQLYFEF